MKKVKGYFSFSKIGTRSFPLVYNSVISHSYLVCAATTNHMGFYSLHLQNIHVYTCEGNSKVNVKFNFKLIVKTAKTQSKCFREGSIFEDLQHFETMFSTEIFHTNRLLLQKATYTKVIDISKHTKFMQ